MARRFRLMVILVFALQVIGTSAQAPAPTPAPNPNTVSAVEFVIDPATLLNLGFEWFIQGDDNRNATVTVSYRKKGESAWQPALPMLRLKGERVYQQSQVDVIAPNMFAGSILDLQPDTAYEAQFVLADPDGVRGESRRVVTVSTRPEPKPYEGGRVFHVYKAEDFDFRLKPGSAGVDKGTPLPNVTEGFSGKAPDLGALEVGGTVPRYGPRQ